MKSIIEATNYSPAIEMFRFFFKAYYLGSLKTGIAMNAGFKAMQKGDIKNGKHDQKA